MLLWTEEWLWANQQQEACWGQSRQDGDNVAFTSVLGSLLSHEVFADEEAAILVFLEAEHWHTVQLWINEAWSANDVSHERNAPPKDWVNQEWSQFYQGSASECEHWEKDNVLEQEGGWRDLERDFGRETLIDEVELNLSLVGVVLLDEPNIFISVEWRIWVAFRLLLRRADVRHCLYTMLQENVPHFWFLRVVEHTKEHIFFSLLEGVLHASHLILHRFTFLTASLDRKECHNIIWPRIL